MSEIRVLIYRLDIHNLQTKTVSFLDQEKILKEVAFSLAVSMNVNTEYSQIKYCPCPKYFKVRNFRTAKFRDFAIFWRIHESLESWNICPWKCSIIQSRKFFSREKYFFLQELTIKYVFISTSLTKLIFFIPLSLEPITKWVISAILNRQKLGNLLI